MRSLRRRRRPDARAAAYADYVGRRAAGFRRRLVLVAVLAVAAVAAVSAVLAIGQYHSAEKAARTNLKTRAAITAAVINVSVSGDISKLEAIARSPAFTTLDRARMRRYLLRVADAAGSQFDGGYEWIAPDGIVEIDTSASPAAPPANAAGRTYFRRVIGDGKPYVSSLAAGRPRRTAVVVAVPTRVGGRVGGVLAARITVRAVSNQKAELKLGVQGLEIIDRSGRSLMSGLAPVSNRELLARIRRGSNGIIAGTRGLDGRGDDVVAYAAVPTPHWWIAIDRPRSAIEARARRSLVFELGSLAAATLVVLGMMWFVVRRARRERELQDARAGALNVLTRTLAEAATPDEVSVGVVAALARGFPDSFAIVVFETVDRERRIRTSQPPSSAPAAGNAEAVETIAGLAMTRRQSLLLERVPGLAAHLGAGRRLRALHCIPAERAAGEVVGGIGLVRPREGPLEESEWALLGSFAAQAAQALERTRRSAHERALAIRLQRGLLPGALPESDGVVLAGHYRAGGEGVEVGGDWYDAVRRPDGIFHLCVGDVIGRGIEAAALMGRCRNAFHAYAYDCVSAAEIVRRMVRHVDEEETMVTMACVSLDPYSGEIAYSCAGHPPPLLVREATRAVRRLDDASAPPLGIAETSAIRETRLAVDERVTLVLYSDGLIERRGRDIDEGISVLGNVVAGTPAASVEETLAEVTAELGDPTDDVALLIAEVSSVPMPFEVVFASDPSQLPTVRRRLRAWLARRQVGRTDAEDVLLAVGEACNNAVEHAYAHDHGAVRVSVDEDGATVHATIRDEGQWRDRRTRDDDRGRGIMIMEALMSHAEIRESPDGTTVFLERRLRSVDAAASRAESTGVIG